jgi:soluble lytic murein transglycosylase-like protein
MFMKNILRILSSVMLCLFVSLSSFGATSDEIKKNIITQAKSMGVDPAIVLSIAKTESGFRQDIKSASGHVGVFQLSPATAKTMGFNAYDLNDNIKCGITYYKNMYNKFGSMELAVAAYQTGPLNIARNGNKVPGYSKPFVSRIMADYRNYKSAGI